MFIKNVIMCVSTLTAVVTGRDNHKKAAASFIEAVSPQSTEYSDAGQTYVETDPQKSETQMFKGPETKSWSSMDPSEWTYSMAEQGRAETRGFIGSETDSLPRWRCNTCRAALLSADMVVPDEVSSSVFGEQASYFMGVAENPNLRLDKPEWQDICSRSGKVFPQCALWANVHCNNCSSLLGVQKLQVRPEVPDECKNHILCGLLSLERIASTPATETTIPTPTAYSQY
jgi:hypothetical protein